MAITIIIAVALVIAALSLLVILGAAKANRMPPFEAVFTPECDSVLSGEKFIINVKCNRAEVLLKRVESDVPVMVEAEKGDVGTIVRVGENGFRIIAKSIDTFTDTQNSITVELVDLQEGERIVRNISYMTYPNSLVVPREIEAPSRILLDEGEQRTFSVGFLPEGCNGIVMAEADDESICAVYTSGKSAVLSALKPGRTVIEFSSDLDPEVRTETLVSVRKKLFIDIEGEFDENTGDLLEMSVMCRSEDNFSYRMTVLLCYTLDGEFVMENANEGFDVFRTNIRSVIPGLAEKISALRCMEVTTLGLWATNIRCNQAKHHLIVHNVYKRQGYWWKSLDINTKEACDSNRKAVLASTHADSRHRSNRRTGNPGEKAVKSCLP